MKNDCWQRPAVSTEAAGDRADLRNASDADMGALFRIDRFRATDAAYVKEIAASLTFALLIAVPDPAAT